MSTTSVRPAADLPASAPSGDAVVARVGTPTLELVGWHHKRYLHPDPNNLYRVITQHRTYEGNAEEVIAMPDTSSWGHLKPVEYQQWTTPGFQWGDNPEDGPAKRPHEFVQTYVGLYRLVGYSMDPWAGTTTGQFERVDGEAA